ncbi:MAG: hypothetical protein JNM00_02180, partial [Flavobacteriales bacterium]|nr:hypothetical protein [Flavobacteriales bacterium]
IWVVYGLLRFPIEMQWTLRSLLMPWYDGTVSHQGVWNSQLFNFSNFFGWTSLVLCGFFLFSSIRRRDPVMGALLIWCLIPLVVFSMSEMKRGSHLMLGAPGIIILVSYAAIYFQKQYRARWLVSAMGWISVVMMIGYAFEKLYLFSAERVRDRPWCDTIKKRTFRRELSSTGNRIISN